MSNDLNVEDVPNGWEFTILKNVVSKLVDGSHNPPKKQDSGIPMLSARNIENNQINFDNYRFIDEDDFEREHARTRIAADDVLLTIVGTIGRTAVVPMGLDNFTLQRSVAVITPQGVHPKYLMYQLEAPFVQRYFEENARGTAQKGVYLKTLGQTPIKVAPLDQQTRIVAEIEKQFSRLDEAVANLKRVKANLKRYKAAVLKAAVEGKLTEEWRKSHVGAGSPRPGVSSPHGSGRGDRAPTQPMETGAELLERILAERREKWQGRGKYKEPVAPDTSGLPELPEGWVWASVIQLSVLVQYGSSAKTSEDPSGVPVLRMGNIVEGQLNYNELKYLSKNHDEFPNLLLQPGDLLFNRTNSPELVGKTAVYTGTVEPCSFASYLIRVRLSPGYLPPLLAYFINSSYGRKWIKSVVTQQVGQANVNGTKLQALPVPLPPLAEQHQIVAEVERRLSIVAEAEAQIDANLRRAERLRQSILKQAFSGRLIPPNCGEGGSHE